MRNIGVTPAQHQRNTGHDLSAPTDRIVKNAHFSMAEVA